MGSCSALCVTLSVLWCVYSQTGGVHDQREARVPDGERPHQHVRSDQQQHRLRGPVHPRRRHQGPMKALQPLIGSPAEGGSLQCNQSEVEDD